MSKLLIVGISILWKGLISFSTPWLWHDLNFHLQSLKVGTVHPALPLNIMDPSRVTMATYHHIMRNLLTTTTTKLKATIICTVWSAQALWNIRTRSLCRVDTTVYSRQPSWNLMEIEAHFIVINWMFIVCCFLRCTFYKEFIILSPLLFEKWILYFCTILILSSMFLA